MLKRRLISAAILLSLSLGLIWLDSNYSVRGQHGLFTIPLLVFLTLGTVWEFSSLLARRWSLSPAIVTWHAALSMAVGLFPLWYSLVLNQDYPQDCPVGRMGWVFIGTAVGLGLSGLHGLARFGGQFETDVEKTAAAERTTLEWLLSSIVISYTVGGMLVWHLIRMRGASQGIYELISLIAITKLADTGAYFTGKLIGKTKLIPQVSPSKSVEGVIGGAVFSITAAYIAFRWLLPMVGVQPGPYAWGPAVLGLLITLFGLVGDLVESMVKRTVGAKDSGTLLPGLGGIWDVTDSLLSTAIVGYLGLLARL